MKKSPAYVVAQAVLIVIQAMALLVLYALLLVMLVAVHPMLVVVAIIGPSAAIAYFNNRQGRHRRPMRRATMRG